MNRTTSLSFFVAALLALLAGAAAADHPLDAVGVLHQYCADQDPTPHKSLILMRQPVMTDELATFGGTVFLSIYTPQVSSATENAKLAVRVRVLRANGGRERLGKMVARPMGEGVVEGEMQVPVALRRGDTILWRYRFHGFGDLDAEQCFLLIGAAAKP